MGKKHKLYYKLYYDPLKEEKERKRIVWLKTALVIGSLFLYTFLIAPFTNKGIFSGHDIGVYAVYGQLFHKALVQGQFPVRIIDWAFPGFNQPLFNYYQSGFYFFPEIISLLGFDNLSSINIAIVLLWLTSSFLMFLFVRNLVTQSNTSPDGGVLAGLTAAALYAFAPYHIGDIFVRGALAEFAALSFVPGIFWGIERFIATKKRIYLGVISLSIGITALIHPPTLFMFGLPILLFTLYLIKNEKDFLTPAVNLFASMFFGIMLAGYFIIPAIFSQSLVHSEWRSLGYYDFHQHFVCWWQLFWSSWNYGTSQPFCSDGMSFQVGLVHWGVVVAVIAVFIKWFNKARKQSRLAIKPFNHLFTLFLVIGLFGLFFTLGISNGLWEDVPFLRTLQYPWRFLAVAVFAFSVLGGFVLSLVQKPLLRIIAFATLIILIFFLYIPYLRPATYYSIRSFNLSQITIPPAEFSYYPRSVQILLSSQEVPKEEAKLEGAGKVALISSAFTRKTWRVELPVQGMLRLYIHYFPGWEVTINQRQAKFAYDNEYGYIEVMINPGLYVVEAKYKGTMVEKVGNFVSVLSILAILVVSIFAKKTKNNI